MGAKMLFRKDFSETKIGSFFNTYAFFRQLASEPIPGQIRESKQEKSPAPPEEKKSKPSFSIFRKAAISKNLAKIQSTATEYAELLLDPYQTCIGHRELPPGTSEVIVGLYNSFKDSEKSAPEGDDLMSARLAWTEVLIYRMANLACKHYVDVGDVDDTVYSSLDDEQKKPLKKIMEELDAKRNSDRYDHGIWSFAYELEKKSEHAQFIKHDANYVRLAHLANLFDSPGNYKWKLSEGLMVMNRLQSINDVSKLNLSPYDIDPSSFSYSDAAKRIRDWK